MQPEDTLAFTANQDMQPIQSQEPENFLTSELLGMKEKCKEYRECLNHRYFKIKTCLKNSVIQNEHEDEEPQRPIRSQKISQLMNCFDEDECHTLLQRQQDHFKCFQNLDRMASQIQKKEKQLQLKSAMHFQQKKEKKLLTENANKPSLD